MPVSGVTKRSNGDVGKASACRRKQLIEKSQILKGSREMMRDVVHPCKFYKKKGEKKKTMIQEIGHQFCGQISHLEGSRTGLPAEFLSSQSYHWRPRIPGCHVMTTHENTWILSILPYFKCGQPVNLGFFAIS